MPESLCYTSLIKGSSKALSDFEEKYASGDIPRIFGKKISRDFSRSKCGSQEEILCYFLESNTFDPFGDIFEISIRFPDLIFDVRINEIYGDSLIGGFSFIAGRSHFVWYDIPFYFDPEDRNDSRFAH